MNTFVNRLFGRSKPEAQNSVMPSSTYPTQADFPQTIEDGSENATRRQLVQVLLRDVLRRSGIPPSWIDCQMLLVASRSRGHGMYLRLVIRHWDERLMNYAYAFQQTLMNEIERFEPKAAEWMHGISWQLELENSCPYKVLPDNTFWKESAKRPTAAALSAGSSSADSAKVASSSANQQTDTAQDLERLFAIRDEELNRQAADGLHPVGYEKTQPSPL